MMLKMTREGEREREKSTFFFFFNLIFIRVVFSIVVVLRFSRTSVCRSGVYASWLHRHTYNIHTCIRCITVSHRHRRRRLGANSCYLCVYYHHHQCLRLKFYSMKNMKSFVSITCLAIEWIWTNKQRNEL